MKVPPLRRAPLRLPGVGRVRPAFNLDRLNYIRQRRQLRTLLVAQERPGRSPLLAFETPEAATRRREIDLRCLRPLAEAYAAAGDYETAASIRELIAAIHAAYGAHGFPNLVDPVFRRALRNRLGSHMIRAVEAALAASVSVRTYTIITKGWRRTADELAAFHRVDILEPLRQHLIRAGLAKLPGWCMFGLHGEYREADGLFHPHFHILVVGEKWRAFEGLRDVTAFKGGAGAPIRNPVVHHDLENVPRQVAYILQGWWPSKGPTDLPGVDVETRRRSAIPEPMRGQYLLWQAQQRFTDMVWLHGVEIRNGQLVPTGKVA